MEENVTSRALDAPLRPGDRVSPRSHPAAASALRAAAVASSVRVALIAAPALVWAALSFSGGSLWYPGSSITDWFVCALVPLGCFVASEELAAIARHRRADAAAAASSVGAALVGPRGADVQLQLEGRRVVAAVVDASQVRVQRRSVLTPAGMRRGVSLRRLRAAARRAGGDPVIVAAGCPGGECDGHPTSGGFEVLCPADLETSHS